MLISLSTIYLIIFSSITILLFYKFILGGSKKPKKNALFIIGPSLSGKTSFFYHLVGKNNADTLMSMQINEIKNFKSGYFKRQYDIIDIPGTGYYRNYIIDNLERAVLVLLFIDSTNKSSVVQSTEYLYDILNSDKCNEEKQILICCNKQDANFPKAKKVIEVELVKEMDNEFSANLIGTDNIEELKDLNKKIQLCKNQIKTYEKEKQAAIIAKREEIRNNLLNNNVNNGVFPLYQDRHGFNQAVDNRIINQIHQDYGNINN